MFSITKSYFAICEKCVLLSSKYIRPKIFQNLSWLFWFLFIVYIFLIKLFHPLNSRTNEGNTILFLFVFPHCVNIMMS